MLANLMRWMSAGLLAILVFRIHEVGEMFVASVCVVGVFAGMSLKISVSFKGRWGKRDCSG